MNIVFKRKRRIFLFVLLGLLSVSCGNSAASLNPFYKTLEERIENERLIKFKEASKDSAMVYFQNFSEVFIEVFEEPSHQKAINDFLGSSETDSDEAQRALLLIFAFHAKLNNNSIKLEELNNNVQQYYERLEKENSREKRIRYQEHQEIVQANNQRWHQGDTLSLVFPVDLMSNGKKSAFQYVYPKTLDYPATDNILEVKGILLDRFYNNTLSSSTDSLDLIFKLKIIELSDINTSILWKEYKIGDDFELNLGDYGRLIE